MFCVVYVLRRAGEKLPAEVVRTRPHVGWLHLGEDARKFYPQEVARLFRNEKDEVDVLDPIISVGRVRTKGGGLLIFGREEVRQSVTIPQTWWARPGPLDDLTTELTPSRSQQNATPAQRLQTDPAVDARRRGEIVGASMTNHYSRRGSFSPVEKS